MKEPVQVLILKIAGEPQGKGRARIGRLSNGRAVAFTPQKTRSYEALIRYEAQVVMESTNSALINGPVLLKVDAHFGIPRSATKRFAAAARAGTALPVKRPDLDNIVKAALDALNTVVFRDDAQVVEIVARKTYSDQPCLIVTVEALNV
jgi:Holliday junction resolvase RusA-like endonuclease